MSSVGWYPDLENHMLVLWALLMLCYDASGRDHGWFAQDFVPEPQDLKFWNETMLCNCKDQRTPCDTTHGGCLKTRDRGCHKLFGGPLCQHVKMGQATFAPKVHSSILDGNEWTCHDVDSSVTITLEETYHFISLYLVSKYEALDKIAVKLIDERGVVLEFYPVSLRLIRITFENSSNALRISSRYRYLGTPTLRYKEISISNMPSTMCSIDLSLGRNIALKSTGFGYSFQRQNPQAKARMVLDGSLARNDDFCWQSYNLRGVKYGYWTIGFPTLCHVNHIAYWGVSDEKKRKHSTGLLVIFHDDIEFQRYQDRKKQTSYFPWESHIEIVSRKPVTLVEFRIQLTSNAAHYNGREVHLRFCEIFVLGELICEAGREGPFCRPCRDYTYGESCFNTCPNCAKGKCNKTTGACLDGCKIGWFREMCNESCGQCSGGCKQNNGVCKVSVCSAGWFGLKCDTKCPATCLGSCARSHGACEACISGYHGFGCEKQCPARCLNGCHQIDGSCTYGCKRGWYGPSCYELCSLTCVNQECAQLNGTCSSGCIRGYHDFHCKGWCGKCKDSRCDQVSGNCFGDCLSGFEGSNCARDQTDGMYMLPWLMVVLLLVCGVNGYIIICRITRTEYHAEPRSLADFSMGSSKNSEGSEEWEEEKLDSARKESVVDSVVKVNALEE